MIAVSDLSYRYDDERALGGVSLTIPDGEFLVVAGPNGSGKTTLVRQFNGLLEPESGEVRVDDTPVGEDLVAARSKVGMVFQDPRDQFVAGTVGADVAFGPENLGLARADIDARVARALDAVGLAEERGTRIETLSGGERERVAIAGALAMEPDHLVLDEPFTGLDWPARRSVLERLDSLHGAGTGIVVVTHDLRDLAARAERIVVLSEGEVVLDGAPEALAGDLEGFGVRPP